MSMSSSFRRRRWLGAVAAGVLAFTVVGPAAGVANATRLSLNWYQLVQQNDQWCWVADGLSVAQYNGRATNWSQNDFCNAGRGLPAGSACPNQPQPLTSVQRGLSAAGVQPGWDANGTVSFSTVQSDINYGEPEVTGINWTTGGGHARVFYGYDNVAGTVLFSDPWPSSQRYQEMSYNSYVSNSQFYWSDTVYNIG